MHHLTWHPQQTYLNREDKQLSTTMISIPRLHRRSVLALVSALSVFALIVSGLSFVHFQTSYQLPYTNKPSQTVTHHTASKGEGYTIEPQNVHFEFINPKGKQGTSDEVIASNIKTYGEIMSHKASQPDGVELTPPPEDVSTYEHANATIIALVRNSEAGDISKTIRDFEKSFNSKYQYPYTFLNDEPFTERFKERMKALSSAAMEFVVIPPELWNPPDHINRAKADEAMEKLDKENVAYAKMLSYHNMCRFYLGTFYNIPELQKYRYYWRIEPNVHFYTDLKYDVFKFMEKAKKVYGFTINLYDIAESIRTLWPETLKFLNQGDNYKYVNKNGAFQWLLDDTQLPQNAAQTGGYSTCHFWSNFEVADMDFYRNSGYDEWFKHLDQSGKFYYERWGDAPVHSIGVALFASKSDVHWFKDIGYMHEPYLNCPLLEDTKGCDAGKFLQFDFLDNQNCMANWVDYL